MPLYIDSADLQRERRGLTILILYTIWSFLSFGSSMCYSWDDLRCDKIVITSDNLKSEDMLDAKATVGAWIEYDSACNFILKFMWKAT